jgi:hypothetical protein
MNNLVILTAFVLVSSVCAIPLPQDLTIAEFRSLRDEETPSAKVFISPSYAQVRRQGRNYGTGEVFSFKRPLPVRHVAATARELNISPKSLNRLEAAPVFNLNDMLRQEAAKLKAKVQEASLAAAKAAEEAEQKLEEMVEKVMDETDATRQEVENIIEEAVETGIEEAEKIIEEEIKEGSGTTSEVEDEIFGDEQNEKSSSSTNDEKKDQEELSKEIINLINDNDEPSKDIDLGSVQEV